MRVGIGYDVHRLAQGRRLILGGVIVPYELGLEGHSDADVLIHAVIDAILGAASLGDIGQHFPADDPCYEGISSLILLRDVAALLERHRWQVANMDATVIAEKPKLAPFITAMREKMAGQLSIDIERVSIKATTSEGLGFLGRGEGIAAYAVVALEKVK
ncbi:MAG: 2-C-methyl-D-erythritol 2,4-cyclodiphosphate synthase [Chloroflexi bacterium]|nr:2-C-methyl-D-erythritol 2,4-cyclodiphosphate synthase [Chloroflexota bacterium]MCL5074978.1 2-C-methyl-D-erythritol 2,4-cyclodiphosphate synthase [Chloroflexota bacterium]